MVLYFPRISYTLPIMAIRPLEDEQHLLGRVAQGDQSAFTEIFNHYYQPLGQAMLRLTESLPLSQEIVQDAFIKVWLSRETLGNVDNFSGYLFVICRNGAFAALKKLARERQLQPVLEQQLQWERELEELDNPAEGYRNLIQQAVAKLPAQQQRIYQLSRQDRLRYVEIAEVLEISPETVKTQVYNAVKFIRSELSSHMAPSVILVLTSVLTSGR